ncbi:GNAT family N-acetyltransferase [Paracoccus gahaiensis]|uniref:GNAT family N-acetyltransferase n=1 Tax=Paracoccus gahaiensis TaxID=1706839 RepID=A0A4U0R3V3_9RHOB|nr:GNAT family N-acetyltransferase [Paracoccus gahaiensis]TJZ89571.1 GNAT family N-acetyltransferase [Paracoccus gahaiensis]
MTVPTLTTARLVLRTMRIADWPGYAALMGSERAEYMGGPFGVAAAWGMFCSDHAQWEFYGSGALMIEDRASGRTLGQVAINRGPLFPEPELGWMVWPDAEGRGIAFEAARAMLDWAQGQAGLDSLVSYVDPGNARSITLALRLGAVRDATAARPDPADLVFCHRVRARA